MIYSDQGRGRIQDNFKPAEEDSFQSGVHTRSDGDIVKDTEARSPVGRGMMTRRSRNAECSSLFLLHYKINCIADPAHRVQRNFE